MNRIARFLEFEGPFITINENVNKAKEILYDDYAKKSKKSVADLTGVEKMKIEEDPKFVQIKNEFGKSNPRLVYPFTKFYVLEGAPWEELLALATKYSQANPGPKSLPLGPIENYAAVKPEEKVPGYLQLDKDLDDFIIDKANRSQEPRVITTSKPKQIRPEVKMMIEKYAKNNKKEVSEITPEEIEEIQKDKRYVKLKEEFLNNYPALMLLYTKIFVIEKDSWENLMALHKKLEDVKPQPGELMVGDGNLSDYVNLDKKKYPLPTAETLMDHLAEVVSARKPKELLNLFTKDHGPDSRARNPEGLRRMKWVYEQLLKSDKKSDKEKIKKLIFIANRLENLPPKEVLDIKTNKKVVRNGWEDFVRSSSKYNDYYAKPENDNMPGGTYPQFVDPFVAFDQMLVDGMDKIEGWSSGQDDLKYDIKSLDPEAAILYDMNGYMVISARTSAIIRKLCAMFNSNYCIANEDTFWNRTAGGRVQLFIANFNVPATDNMSLFTMTIEADGTFQSGASKLNDEGKYRSAYGENKYKFTEVLEKLGYPDNIVSVCKGNFPREQRIKKALEIFFRKATGSTTGKSSKRSMVTSVMNDIHAVHDELTAGTMTEIQWNQICSIVAGIISDTFKMTPKDIVKYFCTDGFSYESDFIIFTKLAKNDFTREEVSEIREATLNNIEVAQESLEDEAFMKVASRSYKGNVFKNIVDSKERLLGLVDSL